jgi:hypothetical protein
MATVMIGGRELVVREATLGLLKTVLPVRRKMKQAEVAEDDSARVDALATLIHCYVGEPINEGVTIEWLLKNVPIDPVPVMEAIYMASGQKVAEPKPGEAARQ